MYLDNIHQHLWFFRFSLPYFPHKHRDQLDYLLKHVYFLNNNDLSELASSPLVSFLYKKSDVTDFKVRAVVTMSPSMKAKLDEIDGQKKELFTNTIVEK